MLRETKSRLSLVSDENKKLPNFYVHFFNNNFCFFLVQKVMNFYNSAQIEETVNQLRLIRTQIDVDRKNKHIVHQNWTENHL